MIQQTCLKVLRIDRGFESSVLEDERRKEVAPSRVVKAVSKLERLELAISKEFKPYINAILTELSKNSTYLSEIVLIFRNKKSRKFTVDLMPEVFSKAVARLKVFTVEKTMMTKEQLVALEKLPGRVNSLGEKFLHIHASGVCTTTCTRVILLKTTN